MQIQSSIKPVTGTNDAYYVSEGGHIVCTNWKGTGQRRVMKPARDKKGYLRTMIKYADGYKTVKVHRLVAQEWVPNPSGYDQVNHINGIKDDNRAENLQWVTGSENMKHAVDMGLVTVPVFKDGIKGAHNGMSKLNEQQVAEIRAKFKPRIYTRAMLAREYGVSPHTIKDAILRRWRHVECP